MSQFTVNNKKDEDDLMSKLFQDMSSMSIDEAQESLRVAQFQVQKLLEEQEKAKRNLMNAERELEEAQTKFLR